jgi:hypothetical protein
MDDPTLELDACPRVTFIYLQLLQSPLHPGTSMQQAFFDSTIEYDTAHSERVHRKRYSMLTHTLQASSVSLSYFSNLVPPLP